MCFAFSLTVSCVCFGVGVVGLGDYENIEYAMTPAMPQMLATAAAMTASAKISSLRSLARSFIRRSSSRSALVLRPNVSDDSLLIWWSFMCLGGWKMFRV